MAAATIWDEIRLSRRKGGNVVGHPGDLDRSFAELVSSSRVIEFSELEDEAESAIQEFVSTHGSKVTKELELRACSGILKYLQAYAYDLEKCSERYISKRLGIPRPRLHGLLRNMEWNGIVERVGIGTYGPYKILNMGKAIKDGYFTLGSGEVDKLTKLVYTTAAESLITDGLTTSLPDCSLFTETIIDVWNRLRKPESPRRFIHIPFHPGQVVHYEEGETGYWYALSFLRLGFVGRISREVLMELGVPDEVRPEDVEKGLRRVAEKYLKLVRLYIRPLLDLLAEHGFEKGKTMIEKAYTKEMLLKMETDSHGRAIPRAKIRSGDRIVDERAMIPGHGYVSYQTQELTPTLVRLVAGVYRRTCDFAEQAGVDPGLVAACRREANQLDIYVEPSTGQEQGQEAQAREEQT